MLRTIRLAAWPAHPAERQLPGRRRTGRWSKRRLGALTAGVGAVGGLVTQGAKCLGGEKGACSAGSFLKAGVVGGIVGGVAGLGGALGGKLLSAVGGKALSAVGGLFGRGGAEVAEGASADIAEGAAADTAASVADGSASSSADNVATSTAEDAGRASPRSGGQPRSEEPNGPSRGGKSEEGGSCPTHSFTAGTLVLLAGTDPEAARSLIARRMDWLSGSVHGVVGRPEPSARDPVDERTSGRLQWRRRIGSSRSMSRNTSAAFRPLMPSLA